LDGERTIENPLPNPPEYRGREQCGQIANLSADYGIAHGPPCAGNFMTIVRLTLIAAFGLVLSVPALAAPIAPPQTAGGSASAIASDAGVDDTYQWSVPVLPEGADRRAYLWVPPDCQRVRGLLFGMQNMLEKPMFQDAGIRKAAAEADLGILWISPGSVGKEKDPPLSSQLPDPLAAVKEFDEIAGRLARESGYSEIQYAPLLVVAHSAATPFGWGFPSVNPSRVFAMLPVKGWLPGGHVKGIPILYVTSEWAEVGGARWCIVWKKDFNSMIKLRQSDDLLAGCAADLGVGHFHWNEAAAPLLGLFIRKAAAARIRRIPNDAPLDKPVTLRPIPIESGVLVDPASLGTPTFKAFGYDQYPGDKKSAFWYLDAEMASRVNDFMAGALARKPQAIDFVVDGKLAPLDKAGMAKSSPKLLSDGVSWKVQAEFLDRAPPQLGFEGPLGHAETTISYKVGSGALRQTGPDTFCVWLGRGNIDRQGNPWEPWVIAWNAGDAMYRGADRPMHFWVPMINKEGTPQTIDFPGIPDQPAGTNSLQLRARASSGLPVQYFVVSGPVRIAGDDALDFLPIPPRAKFPLRVRVGAFQWGRGGSEKVQSAGPEFREFSILGRATK
jgi:hypothetical protein